MAAADIRAVRDVVLANRWCAVAMTPPMPACRSVVSIAIALASLFAAGCTGSGGEDGGSTVQDSGPAPIEPRLSALQARIFTPSCSLASCHGTTAAGRLSLKAGDSYGALVNVRAFARYGCGDAGVDGDGGTLSMLRVVPGDPDHSFLMEKVDHDDAYLSAMCRGRSMPEANPMMGEVYRTAIREWIAQGAQNN
jgi:hypothetical protein